MAERKETGSARFASFASKPLFHLKFESAGYSLPAADFEFRQLLSRMVRKDAEIDVVLFHNGEPSSIQKYDEECHRYRQFFGARKVSANPDGVKAFVEHLGAFQNL